MSKTEQNLHKTVDLLESERNSHLPQVSKSLPPSTDIIEADVMWQSQPSRKICENQSKLSVTDPQSRRKKLSKLLLPTVQLQHLQSLRVSALPRSRRNLYLKELKRRNLKLNRPQIPRKPQISLRLQKFAKIPLQVPLEDQLLHLLSLPPPLSLLQTYLDLLRFLDGNLRLKARFQSIFPCPLFLLFDLLLDGSSRTVSR